jgi:hypothetical protein
MEGDLFLPRATRTDSTIDARLCPTVSNLNDLPASEMKAGLSLTAELTRKPVSSPSNSSAFQRTAHRGSYFLL